MKGIGKRYGEGERGIGERKHQGKNDYIKCVLIIKEITK
jgi:hypothetical protein